MSVPDEVMSHSRVSSSDFGEGGLEVVDSLDDSLFEALPGPDYSSSIAFPSQPLRTESTTGGSVPYQLQSAGDEVEQYAETCPYPTPLPSRSSSPVRRDCPPLEPKQDASRLWPTPKGVNPLGVLELDLLPVQQMSQILFVGIMQLTPQQSQLEVISSSPESLAPATPVRNENVTERGTFNMETPPDYAKSAALDFGTEMLNDLDDLLAAGPIVDPAYDSILPKTPSPPGSPSLRQKMATSRTPVDNNQGPLPAVERTLDDELLDMADKIEMPPSDLPPPPRSASVPKTKTVTDGLKKSDLPDRPRPLLQPAEIRQVIRDVPTFNGTDQAHRAERTSESEVEVIVLGEPSPYEKPTPSQFETDLLTGAAKVIKLLSNQPAPCQWACIRKKPVLQSTATEPDAKPRAGRRKKQKRARDARTPVAGTGFAEEVPSTEDQSILEKIKKQSGTAAEAKCSKPHPMGTPPPESRKPELQANATGSVPTTITWPAKMHEDVQMPDVGIEVDIERNVIPETYGNTSVATGQKILKMDAQLPALTELPVVEKPAGRPVSIAAVLSASPILPNPRKITDAGSQMDSEPWPCAEPGCNRPSERCLINERNLGCESFEALDSGRTIMHSSTSVSPVGSPYCWRCRLEHKTRKRQSTSWAMREAFRRQAEASWLLEERLRIERCRSDVLTKRALKTAAKKRKRAAEMQSGAKNFEILPERMKREAALQSAEMSTFAQQTSETVADAALRSAGTVLSLMTENVPKSDVRMTEPDVEDVKITVLCGAASNADTAAPAQRQIQDPWPPALCEGASAPDPIAMPEHREKADTITKVADLEATPPLRDEERIHARAQPLPVTIEEQISQLPTEDTEITCPASPRPRPLKPDLPACKPCLKAGNVSPPSGAGLLLTIPVTVQAAASNELHVEVSKTAGVEKVSEHDAESHLPQSQSSASVSSSPVLSALCTPVHDLPGPTNSSPRTSPSRYASHTPSPLRSVQSVEDTPPTSPSPRVHASSDRGQEVIALPRESSAIACVAVDPIVRMPRPKSMLAPPVPLSLEEEAIDPLASTVLKALQSHRQVDDGQTPVHLHFCVCGKGLARFPEKLPCRQCINEEYWRYLDELDTENKENIHAIDNVIKSEHETAHSVDLCRLCHSLVTFDEQGLCVPCANPILAGSGDFSRPRKKRRLKQGTQQRLHESSDLSVEADGAVSVEPGVLNPKRRPLKGILKRR